jgi:hypothetical protein
MIHPPGPPIGRPGANLWTALVADYREGAGTGILFGDDKGVS